MSVSSPSYGYSNEHLAELANENKVEELGSFAGKDCAPDCVKTIISLAPTFSADLTAELARDSNFSRYDTERPGVTEAALFLESRREFIVLLWLNSAGRFTSLPECGSCAAEDDLLLDNASSASCNGQLDGYLGILIMVPWILLVQAAAIKTSKPREGEVLEANFASALPHAFSREA